VVVHEWGTYVSKWPDGLVPMYMIGWAGAWDADGIMFPLLRTGQRFSRWSNPEFDAILDKARRTLNEAERVKLYRQATQLAHDEAPWLYLFHGMDIYGVSRSVEDWEPTSDESTSTVMLNAVKKK
jgi:peptide/nickel transport system substrate-binding protein